MPPGGARQRQFAKQDALYAALERLEGKETQHAAFEELSTLIKDLEPANLSTLLHAAGTQTAKTTTFARVHALRLAALCCTQQHCPQWRAMLSQPLLGKLLGLLSRALRDADSAVRTAASEAFGVVAAQLAAADAGAGTALTAGNSSNPLLACILEALGEPGGAVQAAAAAALAQAADHLQPLDPALLRQLLRNLNNPLFLGRAELWRALASLEGGRVRGLVASSFQQLLAAMPEVLGSAAEGTGLFGALTSRGKDFQSRIAAAHTLKALAAGVGPFASGWDAACTVLKTAKTDISKPVRDAAMAALPVVAALQEFVEGGVPPEQWPALCGRLLAAEGSGSKRGSPGAIGKPAVSRPGAGEELGIGPRIPALHPMAAPHAAAMPPLPAGYVAMPSPGGLLYGAPPSFPASPPAVVAYGMPPAVMAPPEAAHVGLGDSPQQLVAQLAAIQEQQAAMAAALSAFTSSTHTTLHRLQQHLASVSAGVAALAGGTAPGGQQAAQLQQQLDAVHAGMAALAVGMGGAQQRQQAVAVAEGSGQGPACAPTCGNLPMAAKRLSSLHRSYNALDQALHHQPLATARQQAQQAACAARSSPGAASAAAAAPSAAPCWEATYAALLAGSSAEGLASSQQGQLKLLRCMAKSGPVWDQLSSGTAQRLVQTMVGLLQEGTALNRLLPWLWPLADTASAAGKAAAALPPGLREQLQAALAAYPLPTIQAQAQPGDGAVGAAGGGAKGDSGSGARVQQLAEKRELLLSALQAVWS